MEKKQYPTTLLGIELKRTAPRGVRNRVKRLLDHWTKIRIKKNFYLLEQKKLAIYQEYISPLINKHGQDFIYNLKK